MAVQTTYKAFRTLQSDVGSMRACRMRIQELRDALPAAVGADAVSAILLELALAGEELDARRRYLDGDERFHNQLHGDALEAA